jgi:putative redox protein
MPISPVYGSCARISLLYIINVVKFMKATIKWVDNAMFLGESGSGHSVVMDGPESAGGRNMGIRPMEMLLIGVGGCSSFDVMSILKKSRQNVVDCRAELNAERADAVPAVFTAIDIKFVVSGYDLKEVQVKRAVELSAEKYCSASIMMTAAGVKVTHSYEIIELGKNES